jgi:hypothetical protein
MELEALLSRFLVFALYPAWLVAGGIDYLCHRRTDISITTGIKESLLHIAQFLVLGCVLTVAVLFDVTRATIAVMAVAVIAHSALALIDVSYTEKRRYISPLEQHVHGYMDVLPVVAVALLAVMHWQALMAPPPFSEQFISQTRITGTQAGWLLLSYFVLGGGPLLSELLSAWRQQSRREAISVAGRSASSG